MSSVSSREKSKIFKITPEVLNGLFGSDAHEGGKLS